MTQAEKRIQKKLIAEIGPAEYTVLRNLIALFYHFELKSSRYKFAMLIPRDLPEKLGMTIAVFFDHVNSLIRRGLLVGRHESFRGIICGINFVYIQTYANYGILYRVGVIVGAVSKYIKGIIRGINEKIEKHFRQA